MNSDCAVYLSELLMNSKVRNISTTHNPNVGATEAANQKIRTILYMFEKDLMNQPDIVQAFAASAEEGAESISTQLNRLLKGVCEQLREAHAKS